MPTESTRHRYARSIRAMSSLPAAMGLLEAFEAECRDWPWDLIEIESLPDWRMSTLLEWAMRAKPPEGFTGEDLMTCRQMRLIGALSKASEQAAMLRDGRTARALAQLAHQATLDLKGTAGLSVAFGTGADETPDA
jgi:hypothetical protein